MNRHLISMLQTGYSTVAVTFMTGSQGLYTYKTRESFQVDDLAVVEVGCEMKIVRVREVHAEPQIDINLTRDYKWIVCKVDTTNYREELEREKIFRKEMFKIESVAPTHSFGQENQRRYGK